MQPVKPGLFVWGGMFRGLRLLLTMETSFSISHSLSAEIKTMEIISHSNSKCRGIVRRENTHNRVMAAFQSGP